jgi:hypothetical protein
MTRHWTVIKEAKLYPKNHKLKNVRTAKRAAAFKLIASGLSPPGFEKATTIVKLEATLGEKARSLSVLLRPPKSLPVPHQGSNLVPQRGLPLSQ